ncbi:MAG: Gfo/Idh/MocA family oxidoreductase [Alphaproteobacteria bacterium]|nr:Gfo/Idh/MocA family oxidoreductase [Alphaproteobacteria bacterium]
MSVSKYNSQRLHYELSGWRLKLKRIVRSLKMWGLHRTFAKIANRLSLPIPVLFNIVPRAKDFLMVGCGQFGCSTASYFIGKQYGHRFLGCFDIDMAQSRRAQRAYGYKHACATFEELLELEGAQRIFIASNHASHTPQAIAALEKGMKVHIEKPISVTWEQLAQLTRAVEGREDDLYVGYNRPFSKAITMVRDMLPDGDGSFTIQHFIAGHAIDPDHWYYDPKEGTRICGNVGHWIDLSVHLLSQRDMADRWTMQISYSDEALREENFSLSMTSEKGDLVTMTFTARGEPFDGVNEAINIQQGDLMARIDDFRTMKVWRRDYFRKVRFWPKDVGHRKSVGQMFDEKPAYRRPWEEIFLSTMLMLHITDMVRNNATVSEFSFAELRAKLDQQETEQP